MPSSRADVEKKGMADETHAGIYSDEKKSTSHQQEHCRGLRVLSKLAGTLLNLKPCQTLSPQ